MARATSHFLAEWYSPELGESAFQATVDRIIERTSVDPAGARLLVALLVPGDEVAFAVFDASSAQAVVDVCRGIGVPVHRITRIAQTYQVASSTSTGA